MSLSLWAYQRGRTNKGQRDHPLPRRIGPYAALESVSTGALSSAQVAGLYHAVSAGFEQFRIFKVRAHSINLKTFRKEKCSLNWPGFVSKES
jgi:hypothetical protein